MRYRQIANTDVQLSEVGFGVWTLAAGWWGDYSDDEAATLMQRAVDRGVTFFDTADTYGRGRGETILAHAFPGAKRDEITIGAKFGYDWQSRDPKNAGQREAPHRLDIPFLEASLDASLKRLGTDRIDVFAMHNPRMAHLENDEVWTWVERIQREGKIRSAGVALGPAIGWEEEGHYAMRNLPIQSVQMIYNALELDPGRALIKTAEETDVSLLVRVPHSSGMLEGHYTADTVFAEHDHRRHRPRSWLVEGVTKVEQLRFLERENNCTLGQAALQWVLRSPSVVSVLPNIYDADQVDEFAAAPDQLPISEAQAAEVERLFETNYGLPVGEPTNATSENVKAGDQLVTTMLPKATGVEFDAISRQLLDLMQEDFPLAERPYAVLGERLGITEADALARLHEARAAGVVRQICAIYDTKALGYSSALVAMSVAPEQLARAAAVVNAHPGVSHNYKRNHEFNMWFTVAMPPGYDLDAVIDRLHVLTGAESTRPMPTLNLFKIGVTLDMSGSRDMTARGAPEYTEERRNAAAAFGLTETDITFIKATQGDIGDTEEPFAPIADALGWTVEEVFAHARKMQESGHLRRFAGILNHRTAGFRANGMAVWNVPSERVSEFGQFVAGYRNISHCYERPTYPDWPYSVFSMIHHPKVAGVEETAAAIGEQTGIKDYRVLYSTTEFKKIRLPYFIPEYDQWEELCMAVAEEGATVSAEDEVLA